MANRLKTIQMITSQGEKEVCPCVEKRNARQTWLKITQSVAGRMRFLVAIPLGVRQTEEAIREGSRSKSDSVRSELARESRLGLLSCFAEWGVESSSHGMLLVGADDGWDGVAERFFVFG